MPHMNLNKNYMGGRSQCCIKGGRGGQLGQFPPGGANTIKEYKIAQGGRREGGRRGAAKGNFAPDRHKALGGHGRSQWTFNLNLEMAVFINTCTALRQGTTSVLAFANLESKLKIWCHSSQNKTIHLFDNYIIKFQGWECHGSNQLPHLPRQYEGSTEARSCPFYKNCTSKHAYNMQCF